MLCPVLHNSEVHVRFFLDVTHRRAVVGKSTEYAEGHEEIEKDGESDTKMTAAQGTCVAGTREHRVT